MPRAWAVSIANDNQPARTHVLPTEKMMRTRPFKCWDDQEEDAKVIEALDAGEAAERYIEGDDEGQFCDRVNVNVRDEIGDVTRWRVAIETVTNYTASPVRGSRG